MQSESTPKPSNGTLKQVAAYMQLSERSVQNYAEWGLLKPVYFGKRRMFRWAEVEKLARTGVPRGAGSRKDQREEVTA